MSSRYSNFAMHVAKINTHVYYCSHLVYLDYALTWSILGHKNDMERKNPENNHHSQMSMKDSF